MTNQVIPAEAVEAAAKAIVAALDADSASLVVVTAADDVTIDAPGFDLVSAARAALEAAAPYMTWVADDALRAAWDRGYAKAVDGMKDVPAAAWEQGREAGIDECAGDGSTANPYILNTEGEK